MNHWANKKARTRERLTDMTEQDPRARGGVKRYMDTVKPEEYVPDFGGIDPKTLSMTALADAYGSDKGTIKHNYTRVYERLIDELLRGKDRLTTSLKIAEFGIACGASIRMWSHYLPASFINGWDVRPECADVCKDISTYYCTIADPAKANKDAYNNHFDLIVDDASHIAEQIVATFKNCWDWTRPGGYYVIEDLGCTYNPAYTQQFRQYFDASAQNERGNFVALVDALMKVCDQKGSVAEFHYYPQLLVIKRQA